VFKLLKTGRTLDCAATGTGPSAVEYYVPLCILLDW